MNAGSGRSLPEKPQGKRKHGIRPGNSLASRIVTMLLLASLLPLAITGAGSWIVFGRLLEDRALYTQRVLVQGHASSIEQYLAERLRCLEVLSSTLAVETLSDGKTLASILETINVSHEDSFADLGVIGVDGRHLAYVGPYDLQHRDYSRSDWFREVQREGVYVSDVFTGYRGVPHCILAVRHGKGESGWILRATINGESFDSLVRSVPEQPDGDAFIIDSQGRYQTTPLHGLLLEQSPILNPQPHRGVRQEWVHVDGSRTVRTTIWMNDGRWMLVVHQSQRQILAPLRRAMGMGAVVVLVAVILMVLTIVLATRHLTHRVERADARNARLSRDLIRSAKLASLGELATGLAHEINNPLAVISTEQTNIQDSLEETDPALDRDSEIRESVHRCKRQVMRCKAITTKMLQFGRQSTSRPAPGDVKEPLEEIVRLLEPQARVQNVDLTLHVDPGLPLAFFDPTELEQVMVNLVNNSLQAITSRGNIDIRVRRSGQEVLLSVADDGSGIPPEDLEWIFEPFFTTKDVGKGTGLGLSVCYGVVRNWGGRLEAQSVPGRGTTMSIHLCTIAPHEPKPSHRDRQEAWA